MGKGMVYLENQIQLCLNILLQDHTNLFLKTPPDSWFERFSPVFLLHQVLAMKESRNLVGLFILLFFFFLNMEPPETNKKE